jgi:Tfp pilus assembly protein PilO
VAALRPRERRLLLLAGILMTGVLGYVYLVEPLMQAHAATVELVAARRGLLARQQRLVARADAYRRELEGLQAEIGRRRGRLLAGDKAPVAASELQKLVKSTAQESGIDVRSERILPPLDRGGYAEVPVEVTFSGPIRGLTAFLHRLDAAPILLALTDLKVRAPAIGTSRDLSATLALSGFIPAPAGLPAPGGSVGGPSAPSRPFTPPLTTPPLGRPGA